MATLQQLINERVARLQKAPEQIVTAAERLQKGILQRLLGQLAGLERDGDVILRNAANLTKAAEITAELQKVLTGREYVKMLAEFALEFEAAKKTSDSLFRKTFKDFSGSEMADLTLATAKARAVEELAGATVTTNFLQPLRGAIEQAVTSGADWTQTLRTMSRLVVGDEEYQGKLARHVKQVAWDALATADRAYNDAVAQDLGAEWFLYSGTELPTTRDFCRERVGKYYTRAMIEAWADLDWDGKMAETTNANTIFQNLGGWNCRHILVPVSAAAVPEWVRAKAEGRTTGQSSVAQRGG